MSSYPYSPQSDDIIRWLGGGVYKHEINNPDNYTKYNKMKTLKNDVLDVVGLFMYVLDKIRRFDVQSRPFTKSSLIEHCKDFTINLDGLQIQERPSCLPTDVVLPDVKFGQIGLGGLLLEVKSLVARYEHIPPRWATRLQKWEDIFWEHDEAAVAKAAALERRKAKQEAEARSRSNAHAKSDSGRI